MAKGRKPVKWKEWKEKALPVIGHNPALRRIKMK
jgi:hypothetical protein